MNQKVPFCITILILLSSIAFANERLLLVTKKTTLRAEPTSIAVKVTRLAVNDTLVFLGKCDNYFCKVSFNGQIGWAKKRCFRELFPPVTKKENAASSPPPPMKIVMPDSTAWDDLPIAEKIKEEKTEVKKDIFQRIEALKAAEIKTIPAKDYGEVIEADDEKLKENNTDGRKSGEILFVFIILLLIFYHLIKKSVLFKKSVPDWDKSIHFKTVNKSDGEANASLRTLLFIIFVAFLFYCFAKNFVFN